MLLALGSAGFWYFSNPAPEKKLSYIKPGTTERATDSDGDALADWEEVLWKTDPENPDTDGDGTPDGEEVKLRRNPAIAGPDDRYQAPDSGEDSKNGVVTEENPTLTSQFLDAFANTVGPRVFSGEVKNITAGDLNKISGFLPDAESLLGTLPYITEKDLSISAEANADAVKRYFNSVYAVYEKTFLKLEEDDLSILTKAVAGETLNAQALKRIDAVLAAFDESIKAVKKIAAPKGYENFAVTEINYLIKSRRVVEILRNADKDLLSSLLMLNFRLALMDEMRAFHQKTGKALLERGIVFSPEEGGFTFLQ